jgi:hypothetical protein
MADFYAWMTELPDGSRSLVGAMIGGFHTPLCAANLELVTDPLMRDIAQLHAERSGQPVTLERFAYAGTLETLSPGEHGQQQGGESAAGHA